MAIWPLACMPQASIVPSSRRQCGPVSTSLKCHAALVFKGVALPLCPQQHRHNLISSCLASWPSTPCLRAPRPSLSSPALRAPRPEPAQPLKWCFSSQPYEQQGLCSAQIACLAEVYRLTVPMHGCSPGLLLCLDLLLSPQMSDMLCSKVTAKGRSAEGTFKKGFRGGQHVSWLGATHDVRTMRRCPYAGTHRSR